MMPLPTYAPELGMPLHAGDVLRTHGCDGAVYDATERHRFALWRIQQDWKAPLVVIGLNPSTATEETDDPTIRRCLGFALDWDYGGLVMLNLFSYRSTNPRLLNWEQRLQTAHGNVGWPESVEGGASNDAYLRWFTHTDRAGAVLAAWGNHGWIAGRDRVVRENLRRAGVQLLSLGVTKMNQPAHPLYIPKSRVPAPYLVGQL